MKINFNKYTRFKLHKCGFHTNNNGYCLINHNIHLELPCQYTGNMSNELSIGAFSYCGKRCEVYSDLSIGRFCSIADDVKIGLHSHPLDSVSTSPYFYAKDWQGGWNDGQQNLRDDFKAVSKVIIQDDVWIGANVCIMHGLTIGKGSVIGAGAIVTKNVEPFTIVGGVPARKIGERKDLGFDVSKYKAIGVLTIDDFMKYESFYGKIKSYIKL